MQGIVEVGGERVCLELMFQLSLQGRQRFGDVIEYVVYQNLRGNMVLEDVILFYYFCKLVDLDLIVRLVQLCR